MAQGYPTPVSVPTSTSAPVPQEMCRVVTNVQAIQVIEEGWSSNLCGFCEDVKSCFCVYFCLPCALASLATRLGESCCYGICCAQHFLNTMRPYVRGKHNIQGSLYDDCCITTFCGPCSVCQVQRELDRRGYPRGLCM